MNKKMKSKKSTSFRDVDELASMRYSKNLNEVHGESLKFGDRAADAVASFVGSWEFIISFAVVLLLWVGANSVMILIRPFDPFPYILLNLLLSCLAAIQAPLIMMSQKRQEAKDRLRAEHDYEVNLKSEILIEEALKSLSRIEKNQREFLKKLERGSGD